MNSPNRRLSRLIELPKLALLAFLLSGSALCQSGPPIPPPISTHTLSFWPLETPPWESFSGQPARAFTNVNLAPSWDYEGTALSMDTNVPAFLQLYVFQDGKTNISLASGSLAVWCQPNWTSVAAGGTGPGAWATVWDIGQYTPDASAGAWLLTVDPSGSNLVWLAQAGGSNQFLWTPIGFNAGDWHQVVTTWSSSNACLYVDGALATNAGPFLCGPGSLECSNDGFCVGSLTASGTNAGTNQFQGQLQWLVSYAQPLTAAEVSNSYAQVADYITYFGYNAPGGGGFHADDGGGLPVLPGDGTNLDGGGGGSEIAGFTPPASISATNYAAYNQFYLTITNDPTNAYVTVCNTLSNLTYEVLTNANMANTNGWGLWQILLASNANTPALPLSLTSNALFFEAVLVGSTGTNGLPDWWQMKYFGQLNVDPYADPDSDSLCNLDEYMLGTNPTNAYSVSSLHKDAQALFLAFTNYDSGCKYELFVTNGSDTNTVLVTMSPTLAGTNYQIYSHNKSDTNDTWIVETNFIGTNSVTTVAVALNGRTLDFVGGYGEDSDGDGLPDGYEVLATWTDPLLPDTGLTGTPDGYKDPDGDGYSNLQEMYNGTNPHVFNTPVGPAGLAVDYNSSSNSITVTWPPADGPVTGYIISAYNYTTKNWDIIATNSAADLLCPITDGSDYTGGYGALYIQLAVQALYSNGVSSQVFGGAIQHPACAQVALAHGPAGKSYMLTSVLDTNIVGYDTYVFDESGYDTPGYPSETYTNIFIPANQFTNGIALMSDSQAYPYAVVSLNSFPVLSGGAIGAETGSQEVYENVPFLDGTTQMKQNIRFLLRAAGAFWPFECDFMDSTSIAYPQDHVYESFYSAAYNGFYNSYEITVPEYFSPFLNNYLFENFIFDSDLIDTDGNLDTGFYPFFLGAAEHYTQYENPEFQFSPYNYAVSNDGGSITAVLSSNETPWVGCFDVNISQFSFNNPGSIDPFGASGGTNSLSMSSASNIYGLPYNSLEVTLIDGGVHFATLAPGTNISGFSSGPVYAGTEQPELQTVDYYFSLPYYDHSPVEDSFPATNTTNLIIGSVGSQINIAGFARQAVLNGNSNVFAYLGQYFSNALVISNGAVTTTSAGILSEYGEFFPTVPGEVALQTMPDPDQRNTNGTCIVNIIRLSLDVNHDGIMDESFTGPDNTSAATPYVFWANNDYDRWTSSSLDGLVEDDVASNSLAADTPWGYVPDSEYRDYDGHRLIPCPRDLEDYARLWVSGISSNMLTNLPPGSTVELWCAYNWDGYEYETNGNPTIDLFQAADSDGGIGYLTNLTTASNQINPSLCQYVGRLGTGQGIQLNGSQFSNNWAGNHFIFCGVSNGVGNLNLTIYDGNGNVLAWSQQYIQIVDVKQMYERWTLGDNDKDLTTVMPMTVPVKVADGQPTCQYPYDPAYDTNDTYILTVHGYNMASWEKDRWAETAYKRLYWQGYQGRFGELRWPTFNRAIYFDASEREAWESGIGLERLLVRLNSCFPGKVYLLAHSLGNVVAGEALRLAGTNILVNTYAASQAALSARAYDNTVPADLTNSYFFINTPDSEGHYFTNSAPPYFNGIGGALNFVDFFNPVDWALSKWKLDQAAKPDLLYNYRTPSSDNPSGYEYTPSPFVTRDLAFTNDTYEIFSRCSQSYSLALGAETNVATRFASITPVDLNASPYDFGPDHPGHSEQFRFDNMTTFPYWDRLLSSFSIQH